MVAREGGGSMSLPDLSKWHEVPRGATLTKGTKYVVLYVDGSFVSNKVYNKLTLDEDLTIRVFTAEPVERPLADVLRDTYLADEDWDNVAVVAQEWFAKQNPETHKDTDGDVWTRRGDGSYVWRGLTCENLSELVKEYGDWEG